MSIMYPGAHSIAALCWHFNPSQLVSALLVNRIQQGRLTIVIYVRVNQQISGNNHRDDITCAGIADINARKRRVVANPVRRFPGGNLEEALSGVHVNCGDSAVVWLDVGNSQTHPRPLTTTVVGMAGEGYAGWLRSVS